MKIQQYIKTLKSLGYTENLLDFNERGEVIPKDKYFNANIHYPATSKFHVFYPGSKIKVQGFPTDSLIMYDSTNYSEHVHEGDLDIEVPSVVIGCQVRMEEGKNVFKMHIISENSFGGENYLSNMTLVFREAYTTEVEKIKPRLYMKSLAKYFPEAFTKIADRYNYPSWAFSKSKFKYSPAIVSYKPLKWNPYGIPMLRSKLSYDNAFSDKAKEFKNLVLTELAHRLRLAWEIPVSEKTTVWFDEVSLIIGELTFSWDSFQDAWKDAMGYAYIFWKSTGLPQKDCIKNCMATILQNSVYLKE